MKIKPLLAVGLFPFLGFSEAQEPVSIVENKKEGDHIKVSLLALGEAPKPQFIVGNGKRTIDDSVDYQSKAVPAPLYVKVVGEKEGGNKSKWVPFYIRFNSLSQPLKILVTGAVVFKTNKIEGESSSSRPYIVLNVPKGSKSITGILYKKTPTANWTAEPETVCLVNDMVKFPLGSVRLVNMSSYPLLFEHGGKRFQLAPKSLRILTKIQSANETGISFKAFALEKSVLRPIADYAEPFSSEKRLTFVTYDREKGSSSTRSAVKWTSYAEPSETTLPRTTPGEEEATGNSGSGNEQS